MTPELLTARATPSLQMPARLLRLLALALLALLLAGCTTAGKTWQVIRDPSIPIGYPEERPTLVDLSMIAEPNANPNLEGEGTPVRFQVLQLKDDSMLMAADLDQLKRDLEEALGTNYLTHDDFTLLPGQWKFYEPFEIDPETRYIGVIAFYATPNEAEWKKVVRVQSQAEHYHLLLHLRENEVELRTEGVSTDGVRTADVSPGDARTADASTGDISTEGVGTEDARTADASTGGISAEGVGTEDARTENVDTQARSASASALSAALGMNER